MSDAPTDLNLYRRTVLQARVDRARRDLAQDEEYVREDAEIVAGLRRY